MISNRARKKPTAKYPLSSCRDEIALIGDYLTNTLNKFERAGFEAHLSACQDCGAFLATYKKTVELTRGFLRQREQDQPQRHLQLRA